MLFVAECDSNEDYIYHYSIEDRKCIPNLFPFASWPGATINPQWFELPIQVCFFIIGEIILWLSCELCSFWKNRLLYELSTCSHKEQKGKQIARTGSKLVPIKK